MQPALRCATMSVYGTAASARGGDGPSSSENYYRVVDPSPANTPATRQPSDGLYSVASSGSGGHYAAPTEVSIDYDDGDTILDADVLYRVFSGRNDVKPLIPQKWRQCWMAIRGDRVFLLSARPRVDRSAFELGCLQINSGSSTRMLVKSSKTDSGGKRELTLRVRVDTGTVLLRHADRDMTKKIQATIEQQIADYKEMTVESDGKGGDAVYYLGSEYGGAGDGQVYQDALNMDDVYGDGSCIGIEAFTYLDANRASAEAMLAEAGVGKYLLRGASSSAQDRSFSVLRKNGVQHYRFKHLPGGRYTFNNHNCASVAELVEAHVKDMEKQHR